MQNILLNPVFIILTAIVLYTPYHALIFKKDRRKLREPAPVCGISPGSFRTVGAPEVLALEFSANLAQSISCVEGR